MLFADSPIFNVQIFQDKTSREDGNVIKFTKFLFS